MFFRNSSSLVGDPKRPVRYARKVAEAVSQKEGIPLNQFINLAVAEKVAHLQHDEWLARRPKATPVSIAQALAILDRPTPHEPDAEDQLPKSYRATRSVARR